MHLILEKYFEIIRKFLPKSKETTAVGLDIGAGECKLVEVKKISDGYELINWAVEPVGSGGTKTAVQNIMGKLQNPCRAPYSAVFGKGTLIRYIDMPRMSLEDLRNSFTIEADKYFPFSQDQIYTDCYIIEEQEKAKKMAVMAAAVKKELIDERVKMFSGLGLQVEFVGINPVALANVVHMLGYGQDNPPKNSAVAILDMGDSVSSLMILVNGLPRFTRDVYLGGRDLTKRISNALGVSFEEAEKLKNNPGPRRKDIVGASETVVMNMVQEVRLSFDYFMTEKSGEISKLYLTGGGSMLAGISEIFQKHLGVDVRAWNPMNLLKVSDQVPKEELNKYSMRLGVALGLALYHYD